MKKPIVAIVYDFDKTLCQEDMQNYSFIPALGMTPSEFWHEVSVFPSFVNYLEKFRRNKVKKETIIIKTMIF